MMSCPFFMYDKQQGPSRYYWNFEGPCSYISLDGECGRLFFFCQWNGHVVTFAGRIDTCDEHYFVG